MDRDAEPQPPTPPDGPAIRAFYDDFTRKLIRDYVRGNLRQARAFELVRSTIGPETSSILDVGCGIGASSAAYLEGHPNATVHGVDISPNNVQVARTLFASSRLRFSVSDMEGPPGDQRYDLIALVDMHEHIPREKWPAFHRTLGSSLSDRGTVVMTTPSPLHQEYLRAHKPEGIQVVDETLVLGDITELARRLDATVLRYEWVSLWHTNDYVHVVLSRAPRFVAIPRRARWVLPARPPAIMGRAEDLARRIAARAGRARRLRHVRKALGVSIIAVILGLAEELRAGRDSGQRPVHGEGQLTSPA